MRAAPAAAVLRFSRARFLRLRSAFQRTVGLDPRPIASALYRPYAHRRYGSRVARTQARETFDPTLPRRRTIGQLVADTLRFYGRNFWRVLPLGIGPAFLTVATAATPRPVDLAILVVGFPVLMTISYAGACFLVSGLPLDIGLARTAAVVGLMIAVPVPFLVALVVLPAVLWLALLGLAVPAAVIEGLGVRASLGRGMALGRADFVHSAGAIVTLVVLVVLTELILFQLLHGLSEQAVAIAAFLANLVVSPLLFLGSAQLYYDQVARSE